MHRSIFNISFQSVATVIAVNHSNNWRNNLVDSRASFFTLAFVTPETVYMDVQSYMFRNRAKGSSYSATD